MIAISAEVIVISAGMIAILAWMIPITVGVIGITTAIIANLAEMFPEPFRILIDICEGSKVIYRTASNILELSENVHVLSVESNVTLGASLMSFFHQQPDPKQWETEDQHQREHNPSSTADVAGRVRRAVSATVGTFVLCRVRLAHWRDSLFAFSLASKLFAPAGLAEISWIMSWNSPIWLRYQVLKLLHTL